VGLTTPHHKNHTCYDKSHRASDLDAFFGRLLVEKPEGKRPVGRPGRTWIDNIKMDLLEIGLSVMDWICLAQDSYRWRALVNAVMNLRVP
jgi:hypothetical protein